MAHMKYTHSFYPYSVPKGFLCDPYTFCTTFYKVMKQEGNLATPKIQRMFWLWLLHNLVILWWVIHTVNKHSDQNYSDWKFCLLRFSCFKVWIPLLFQWSIWINSKVHNQIFHKEENLKKKSAFRGSFINTHKNEFHKVVCSKECQKVVEHWFRLFTVWMLYTATMLDTFYKSVTQKYKPITKIN